VRRKIIRRHEHDVRAESIATVSTQETPAESSWGLEFLWGGTTAAAHAKEEASSLQPHWDLNNDGRLDTKELMHLKRNDSDKHTRAMDADADGDGEDDGGMGLQLRCETRNNVTSI